jgi:hypothetical protein
MEQDKSGDFSDVLDIIEFYRVRKAGTAVINRTVEERIFKRLAGIEGERRARVIDWLLENRPKNHGLDLPAVDEAVARVRGYETAFVPARKVTCECCGIEYQYKRYANEGDQLHRAIFDRCPRCGYDAGETIHAQEYRARLGREEEGHAERVEKHRDRWVRGGREWRYNRDDELLREQIMTSGTEEEKRVLEELEEERIAQIIRKGAVQYPFLKDAFQHLFEGALQ